MFLRYNVIRIGGVLQSENIWERKHGIQGNRYHNILFMVFVRRVLPSSRYISRPKLLHQRHIISSNSTHTLSYPLQPLPEVIRIEEPRQPLIQIHHVRLALARIPHDDLRILPTRILLRIHAQPLIDL